jgi:hypothetical protein
MSRATALLAKVNSTLRKFTPLTYNVYKRTITRTGGNDLIGRAGSTTTVDTKLDPQPYYEMIGRQPVSGGRARVETAATSTGERTLDDYKFMFSPDSMSFAEMQSKNVMLVFKDSNGVEKELLQILDFRPVAMNELVVAIVLFARSVKRT